MDTRTRLERFYRKYNADKAHEVDGLLERFKGKETQLFASLTKKYGPEPAEDEDLPSAPSESTSAPAPAPIPQASPQVQDYNRTRLLAFYEKYNPTKTHEVDSLLAKYKNKEDKLFDALVKKYGPEPGDSEEEDEGDENEEEEEEEEESDEEEDGEPKLRSVTYCPIDTLPPEYCEYGPHFDKCKPWLAEHCPDLTLQKYNRTVTDFLEAERQIAAGVEGITLEASGKTAKQKGKKGKQTAVKNPEDCIVYVSKSARKGRKRLTFLTGIEDFVGQDKIKETTKAMGKKFACSSSVSKTDTGAHQIQLQGDCVTELIEVLQETYGIPEKQIVITEETKKKGKK